MSKQGEAGQETAPIEQRWVDAQASERRGPEVTFEADTDARIAALLADVPPPPALPPERLAAIAARLPRRRLPTRLPARLGLRWALAVSFLLGGVSAVWARKQVAQLWDQVTGAQDNPARSQAPRTRKHRSGVSAETPAGQPTVSAETPEEASTPKREELPVRPRPPQAGEGGGEGPPPLANTDPLPIPPQPRAAPLAKTDPLPVAPHPRAKLIAKTEPLPVRPRPPQAGEGRGEGPAGIPRHVPRPPAAAPASPPADDPLAALTPPPHPTVPPPPSETADVLMPLPPRPPATSPPGSALHEEAALLRSAIESLRVDRRPSAALAAVSEHRRRFPNGALATDAQLLRVEALIALGRRQEALVALDDHRLAGESPGGTLQVTRAELLADRNCREAIAAFDDLLASATSAPLTIERALRGRAICHTRTGDTEAARRDWRDYLRRFPGGRFKKEADAAGDQIRDAQ